MTPAVHFAASGDGLRVWRGAELVAVIPRDLLPALILDAATVLRDGLSRPARAIDPPCGALPPVCTLDA